MTDFTKEFIAEARESITEPGVERYICIPVQLEMLDEIERLQSRIAELEGAKCETCVHYVTYSYKFYSYPCSECKHRSRDSYMPLPESPKESEK